MKAKIATLKDQYAEATSEKQFKEIDRQMKELSAMDPDAFASAMVELARESADQAAELNLRNKLKDVVPAVSLAYIAKSYFGKTRQWLYQRINGTIVNGKPAKFSREELKILEDAFNDMGNKLISLHIS
ncbi:MAG: DUF5053 domain-containing protein [Culturomica sp.]|jgi:hypothetical protein|nr:DUF5053 domain-containing protein [Culturomica sp.]